jgi:Ca2+-dependent lipid-binding protein
MTLGLLLAAPLPSYTELPWLHVCAATQVPVLVSELDLECQMWIKIRLAPMCPWIGTLSIAFVGPPNVKVQLSPYNRVRLMRVPVVQVGADK